MTNATSNNEERINQRTDTAFLLTLDEDHHNGELPSPLTKLNVNMVSQIPLDYMHLVCLGVMRKLATQWMRGPLGTRLPSSSILEISARLNSLKQCIPLEFARKPRDLREIDRFKVTGLKLPNFASYFCIPGQLSSMVSLVFQMKCTNTFCFYSLHSRAC